MRYAPSRLGCVSSPYRLMSGRSRRAICHAVPAGTTVPDTFPASRWYVALMRRCMPWYVPSSGIFPALPGSPLRRAGVWYSTIRVRAPPGAERASCASCAT